MPGLASSSMQHIGCPDIINDGGGWLVITSKDYAGQFDLHSKKWKDAEWKDILMLCVDIFVVESSRLRPIYELFAMK